MREDVPETQLLRLALHKGDHVTRKAGLKVPRYQRPYTWSEREVRELIQDLWRAYKRGASFYFIGQIVLVKNSQGKLEISDGQQRLATLTMILGYVRDRLPGRAKLYQSLIMDGDQPLKRWWLVAPRALRGLSRSPRVTFMLTRYPARLAWHDWFGWRLRIPKATLALAAMARGCLHRVVGRATRWSACAGSSPCA